MGIDSLTALNSIFKEYFEPGIYDTINYAVPLLAEIPKKTISMTGKNTTSFTYQTQLPEAGFGARRMKEALPNTGARKWSQVPVNIAYLYFRMSMEGQVDALVRSPALVNYMQTEVDSAGKVWSMQIARQTVSDGSGVIATITAIGGTYVDVDSAKYIRPSAIFDAYGESAVPGVFEKRTPVSTYTVTKVNRMINRVTLTDVSNLVVGDKFYIYDSAYLNDDATEVMSKEMVGIEAGIDDSNTYCTIDRTDDANDFFRSIVDDNGGTPRNLSLGLIEAFIDAMKANNADPRMIKTSDGVRRSYTKLLRDWHVPAETVMSSTGRGVLKWTQDGVTFELDGNFMMPSGTMYVLSPDNFTRLVGKERSFIGKGPWQPAADVLYDCMYAAMSSYEGLFVNQPSKCGVIKDITEIGLSDYHTI